MPKLKKVSTKQPPKGWELIEPTLSELNDKIKETNNTNENKNTESLWGILRLHHQMSRYIYELFTFKKEISKELYEYCLNEKWADKNLIAKWKKPGYEKVCCLMCIQPKNHNYGTTCICRVPKSDLDKGKLVECKHCGCRGCVTYDIGK